MSRPHEERTFAENNDNLAGAQEFSQSEPVAEEPKVVGSKEEMNEETVLDKEAVEEAESSSNGDDVAKEKRLGVQRTASNWTQATGTSYASSVQQEAELAPRKQTWSEKLNPLKSRYPPPVPSERIPSREHKAGFFSVLYFQWINPLMVAGYQRPLELNDIWQVNPDRSVYVLSEKLNAAYKKRKAQGGKNRMAMALFDTFKFEFILGGSCQLTSAILQVMSPFVMKYLIEFAGEAYYASQGLAPTPPIGRGLGLVFGITGMQIVQSMCTNHFIYRGMMVGGQARAVLISVIFDKAMVISGRAKAGGEGAEKRPDDLVAGSKEEKEFFERKLGKEKAKGVSGDGQGWSNGKIVNLMSTDTYRVDQASGMFHVTWTSVLQVFLTLALLLVNLTYSALAGFGLIVVLMPLLGRSIKTLMSRRKFINKVTDQRVGLTQEILSSVRFVKYFGWETSFLDRLNQIRTKEINKIAFLLSIRNGIMAVSMSIPIFASMLAFITYSLTHGAGSLDPAPVFSSLALFNALRIPLNLLPMVIGQVVDANASLARIEEFLNAEEQLDEAVWDTEAKHAISVKSADFTWERTPTQDSEQVLGKGPKSQKQLKQEKKDTKAKDKEDKRKSKQIEKGIAEELPSSVSSSTLADGDDKPFAINGINLSIGRNELVAIIGGVGSGKSSLLGALAGDMRRTGGDVTLAGSRAFCPQYAWIQNATLKDNITFGKEYDRRWYN